MSRNYSNSNILLERAKRVTPLGAQTYSKSYRYFCEGNSPSFIEKGEGCYVWDIDGNKYIDFICALGPVIIGYNDARVNKAIIAQLEKGISFSMSSRVELELAEKLTEIIPCAEMVRFVKNGSDATTAAIRLARAYTNRDIVAVCGYHGMHDWYIGSTVNNRGVPKQVCELTKTFEYNNIDSLKEVFNKYPNQVAAVILEPIQGNGAEEGYLQVLKELVHSNGAILVFDEVVSGFRYALGGASELYNVVPDMAAFGKGMGNGLPISVLAGKKEIMELIGTKGVFISTTFGGEALSLSGALETIKVLEQPGTYEYIWKLGKMMLNGIQTLVEKYDVSEAVKLTGLPPHGGVVFEGIGSLDYLDINSVYQQRMIDMGILTVGVNNICLSHTEREVAKYLEATESAILDIRRARENDSLDGILHGGKVNPIFKRNSR
ncbi:MAG: aminotransferase class III-fold pyridoxal phosphate-dependent enzyme [Clostridia bacterium]|nr:aminotransferase class III-fold pyridoxal phosphate-dependent enzyme [Clostridia bacterium]